MQGGGEGVEAMGLGCVCVRAGGGGVGVDDRQQYDFQSLQEIWASLLPVIFPTFIRL